MHPYIYTYCVHARYTYTCILLHIYTLYTIYSCTCCIHTIPLQVDPATHIISYGPKTLMSTNFIANIARLSDTSFAAIFYDNTYNQSFAQPYYHELSSALAVQHGMIDTATLSITLSTASPAFDETYAPDIASPNPPVLIGLSANNLLVVYYALTATTNATARAITTTLISITYTSTTPSAPIVSLQVVTSRTLKNSQTRYNFHGTRIDDTTAVIAYEDDTTNHGISTQLIQITSQYIDTFVSPSYDDANDGNTTILLYIYALYYDVYYTIIYTYYYYITMYYTCYITV